MFQDEDSEKNFNDLVQTLRSGSVTAFIGAGLSASHQPTWKELHSLLQEAANAEPRREFKPEHAPVDMEYFREVLGSDRFLHLLKQQFGGPVADYPIPYQIIDETAGFGHIVTTNFDEYLATVAHKNNRNPQFSTYPALQPWDARYIYLHGRALTANEAGDLVICEDDYARAYGREFGPFATVRTLLTGTVVFIGYSLSDGDIQATLRGLKAFRSDRPGAVSGKLFIFRSVDPETLARDILIESDRLQRRWGLHPIWYLKESGHPGLEMLLRQLQHDAGTRGRDFLFIERVLDLQQLGSLSSPNQVQVDQVVAALRVPEAAWQFFQHATSLAWYEPLLDAGMLEAVAEPRQLSTGGVSMPTWAAATYIVRIATQRPDAVVELARRLRDTKNWTVRHTLSGLAKSLPNDYLQQILPILAYWLDRPSSIARDFISYAFLDVMETLCERRAIALAIDGLELLIQVPSSANDSESSLELRVDSHELERLRIMLPILVSEEPERLYILFKDRVYNATKQLPSWHMSRLWRAALAVHESGAFDHEVLNFLVTGMRDALVAWVREDRVSGSAEIERLIRAEDELSYRLALYVITERPEAINLLSVNVFDESRFSNQNRVYELAVLLHRRFGDLRDEERDLVHQVIASGIPVEEDTDLSEDDRSQIVDRWRWLWIGAIPEGFRTPIEQTQWENLRQIYGDLSQYLSPQPRSQIARDILAEPTDLVELEKAREAGPSEILRVLRLEGQWNALGSLVRADPVGLLELADHFEPIDYDHVDGYFNAYRDLLGESQEVFPWTPVIALMERVAEQADSQQLLNMMWLLSSGIVARTSPVPSDLLVQTLGLAAMVLTRTATPLGSGHANRDGIRFHQLNSPAGQAAEGFMHCFWRMAEQNKAEHPGIPEAVQSYITDALQTGWGGVELRFEIGRTVRLFNWCQPGWIETNFPELVLEGESATAFDAQYAFLHGYLIGAPYNPVSMRSVVPLWTRVMPDLESEEPRYLDERMSAEQFAEHVMLGWVFDVEGYEHDGLLGRLIEHAPDPIRAHIVRWAADQFHCYSEEETRQRWMDKLDRYWEWRVEELGDLPVSSSNEELAAFVYWAREAGISLIDAEERLNISIEHLPTHYGVYRVLEYLAERGAEEPESAARLLRCLVERWARDQQAFVVPTAKVDAVFDAICQGEGSFHDDLLKAIDRLVEAGRTDLHEKLEQWGLQDYLSG